MGQDSKQTEGTNNLSQLLSSGKVTFVMQVKAVTFASTNILMNINYQKSNNKMIQWKREIISPGKLECLI